MKAGENRRKKMHATSLSLTTIGIITLIATLSCDEFVIRNNGITQFNTLSLEKTCRNPSDDMIGPKIKENNNGQNRVEHTNRAVISR